MNEVLLSHPDKKLITHLSETARIADQTIQGKSFNFSLEFGNEQIDITNIIPDLIYLTAAFHDLGKATSFFQKYIRNPEAKHDKRKNHALLSAFFVYFISHKFLIAKRINENIVQLLSVFTFSAVKRHHGKLDNLANEIIIEEEYQDLMIEQVKSIDEKKIKEIIKRLLVKYQIKVEWEDFVSFIEDREYNEVFDDFSFDFLDKELKDLPEKTRIILFYIHQEIYSSLLFADKNEVIIDKEPGSVVKTDIVQKIDEFRERYNFNNPDTAINELKNKAFHESAKQLEKVFDKNNHIYSVTLPTGLGKTITAFMLADKMRKLVGFNSSKIIINIPFTSIIDQNFEVYADILKTKDSNILLKHHHLAEPLYKTDENVANYHVSKFLIETWQADTVVTTFVQLLETLLSCDKAKLMKFSNLANSIILLDEIQTIRYELWETIRETFKILGEKFNIYFILISATQPLIFTPEKDIIEIVPYYKMYFNFFNRTKLIINPDKISLDEFKTTVATYVEDNPDKDILIIVNTKRAARELFKYICDEIKVNRKELYFLTTLITPFERKEIIRRIKRSSDKQKVIVSTQLVEAGVDISVDTVFRQISPLDSIIQSAGRANRYSEKTDIAKVYIYDIAELKKVSNFVYGPDLLIKTENVLKDFRVVEEKDYINIIERYFVEVRKQSDNTSNKLLDAIENLEFTNVNLKIIEERNTESIYIQLNKKAKEIWEKYVEIYSKEDLKPWEREEEFSEIKSEFYDFVINVPIPFNAEHIAFDSEKEYNFYVSRFDSTSRNYHYSENDFSLNTGYDDTNPIVSFI